MHRFFTSFLTDVQLLFVKNVDFLSLCHDVQSLLVENNLKYIGCLCACSVLQKWELLDNQVFSENCEAIYRQGCIYYNQYYATLPTSDIACFKLFVAIMMFTPCNYTYNTKKGSRYLKDMKAALYFSNLIERLFALKSAY